MKEDSPDYRHMQQYGAIALSRTSAQLRTKSALSYWCLAAIVLVGIAIVVIDGLSRPLVLEEDWVSTEAMTYEPYHAATVFALVMIPLMFAYRASLRISKKETVLLWFVMCTVAYAKDFSYVRIPGVPLFVTDIVLGGLILGLLGSLRHGFASLGRGFRVALVLFCFSGVVCAGRGFLSGQDKLLVLRDSAIVVYSTFLLVTFLLVSSWDAVKRLFVFFALGALFSSLNAFAWFVMQPGQRRYISYGPYVLGAMLGGVVLTNGRQIRPTVGWLLCCVLGVGTLLANARTLYVTLGLILVVMVFVGPSARLRIGRRTLKLILGISVASVLLAGALMQTKAGADLLNTAMTELESGTLNYADDPNAGFRFLAWMEAGRRFIQNPVIGEGFGVPFSFELTDFDVRPHNTFLTVLYKMGLLGFLPLAWLVVSFHLRGWGSLRSFRGHPGALLLYVLLSAQLSASVFGCLNLLLESPFLASVFWIMLGAGLRIMGLVSASPQISLPACGVSHSARVVDSMIKSGETGVCYGVTSAFLLKALEVNDHGTLHSIDLPPLGKDADQFVGRLIPSDLRSRWNLYRGSSRLLLPKVLRRVGGVGLFVHDSLHTYRNMLGEFLAVGTWSFRKAMRPV